LRGELGQNWARLCNCEEIVPHNATPRNFQSLPALRKSLPAALQAMAVELAAAMPDVQLEALRDTRDLHRRLFAPLLPQELLHAAGTYRGTPGTALETLERAVFISRKAPGLRNQDHCSRASEVAGAMDALGIRIAELWTGPAANRDAAYTALAEVTHGFLATHPYMDGNGHIYRLILPVLARRLGLTARREWTLHPRPYDHIMSLCLQWYPDHPELLACYLRRWFDP
jgi:fido (protein-threonine AMPylation protein)